MIPAAIALVSLAAAAPVAIGAGLRQVFREDATFDAVQASLTPSWGPLGLELSGAWGLGALAPSSVEAMLVEIAANAGSPDFEPTLSVDRATLGLAAVLAPPIPTGGRALQGGPRALIGVEGRLLSTGRLVADEATGWTVLDEDRRLGLGPVLGLGFALCPLPRAALRLDARDRVLIQDAERRTLDGEALRHDWTLSLDLALLVGGGR